MMPFTLYLQTTVLKLSQMRDSLVKVPELWVFYVLYAQLIIDGPKNCRYDSELLKRNSSSSKYFFIDSHCEVFQKRFSLMNLKRDIKNLRLQVVNIQELLFL